MDGEEEKSLFRRFFQFFSFQFVGRVFFFELLQFVVQLCVSFTVIVCGLFFCCSFRLPSVRCGAIDQHIYVRAGWMQKSKDNECDLC